MQVQRAGCACMGTAELVYGGREARQEQSPNLHNSLCYTRDTECEHIYQCTLSRRPPNQSALLVHHRSVFVYDIPLSLLLLDLRRFAWMIAACSQAKLG